MLTTHASLNVVLVGWQIYEIIGIIGIGQISSYHALIIPKRKAIAKRGAVMQFRLYSEAEQQFQIKC